MAPLMQFDTVTAMPAYGKDYRSAGEVAEAWHQGKDFATTGISTGLGRYFSIRDAEHLKQHGKTTVAIRYNRLRDVVMIDL